MSWSLTLRADRTIEERDLVRVFGDQYRVYRDNVGMLFPMPRRPANDAASDPTARRDNVYPM